MNEQQHDIYSRHIKEIEDIKISLHALPETVKLTVSEQLEARVETLNKEIKTLIDDTHKVPLLFFSPTTTSIIMSIITIKIPTLAIIVKKVPHGMRKYVPDPRSMFEDTYYLVFICGHTLQPVPCGILTIIIILLI